MSPVFIIVYNMKTYDQLSEAEKQKIEYEAKVKNEARDQDLIAWGCAGYMAVLFFLLIYALLSALAN